MGTGSARPAQPVRVIFSSLQDLQVWLDRYALRAPYATPPELEPEDGILEGPLLGNVLRIWSSVIIKGGRLKLGPYRIEVRGGVSVVFERVHIDWCPAVATVSAAEAAAHSGSVPPQHGGGGDLLGPAAVTVAGKGTQLTMRECKVLCAEIGTGAAPIRAGCVLAHQGGRVQLDGCVLSGAPCFGLAVFGQGSVASAKATPAWCCGSAGFLAVAGGELEATDCRAQYGGVPAGRKLNRAAVVAAAEADVAVKRNEALPQGSGLAPFITADGKPHLGAGFFAADGGIVRLYGVCVGHRNGCGGFVSWGPGADLAVVAAADGGGIAIASQNGWGGFYACGAGAQLDAGAGARALENVVAGFAAYEGSELRAGANCMAKENKGDGWIADGSRVKAGPGCSSEGNGGRGWLSQEQGGVMVAGERCSAVGNGLDGFASIGSKLSVGRGAVSCDNGMDGFTVSDGGELDASAGGCQARANKQHGFCAEDEGSVLQVGPDGLAQDNGAWGARVEGRGALLRLGQGWWSAGNQGPNQGEENGGGLERA
ncbi:hypothetical protein GPECTOR_2g1387 [Gonium pectorale]|uniref:Right handed beta helix domain-containing protein n=1 Tax=Gonium pectorale TaxID=33097 RepID=A0A150H0Z5_GONPE|nr:hypothetical protein GPECTOR_2g1387 [Gonium pectorale]|eukprot:KXZ55836.1 hypothetical protein GPECTOR_2g1387 [Gonium pectorale]